MAAGAADLENLPESADSSAAKADECTAVKRMHACKTRRKRIISSSPLEIAEFCLPRARHHVRWAYCSALSSARLTSASNIGSL